MRRAALLACLAAALAALPPLARPAAAQVPEGLPPGPRVNIVAVTQPLPTQPQYTRVDIPVLREAVPARSGGRIAVQLATHAERNLSGTEIVRLVRSGQAEIGGGTLTTVSGDVPMLDGMDLAGLSPDIATARRIADAILPLANRELERFGVRVLTFYPFPAQVIFCRQPFTEPRRPPRPQDPHLRQLARGLRQRAGRAAGLHRLPGGVLGAGARRGGLRDHRHRQRRGGPLAGGRPRTSPTCRSPGRSPATSPTSPGGTASTPPCAPSWKPPSAR